MTDVIIAFELLAVFGGVMWFGWRQAKLMERSRAEDARRAAEDEERGAR